MNFYKPFFGESRNLSPDLLCKVCKVSARGSHRRESIYRKSITGSKRYILILLTACNGFPSGGPRKWRRQGSHADRREACLPYGT